MAMALGAMFLYLDKLLTKINYIYTFTYLGCMDTGDSQCQTAKDTLAVIRYHIT